MASQHWSPGHSFEDSDPHLLDLRFAANILTFAQATLELGNMWVEWLREIGLCLTASKTKVLSTETQPPQFVITAAGQHVLIVDSSSCHRGLGCMLSPEVLKPQLRTWVFFRKRQHGSFLQRRKIYVITMCQYANAWTVGSAVCLDATWCNARWTTSCHLGLMFAADAPRWSVFRDDFTILLPQWVTMSYGNRGMCVRNELFHSPAP